MNYIDFQQIVKKVELNQFIEVGKDREGSVYIPTQRWTGEKRLTYQEFPWWIKINNENLKGYWARLSELLYEQCTSNLHYGDVFRNFRNQW